jgi:ribose 5-phosphate isomerase A
LTIDGADEIDPKLRLSKGRGGALLHEKIVAAASDRVVIIADASKLVPVLRGPVPIEVIPFGFEHLALKLKAIGGTPRLRLDDAGKAYVTEEGNWILDTAFGEIRDPEKLGRELDGLIGLVEHGLFVGMAQTAFVGEGSEVRIL